MRSDALELFGLRDDELLPDLHITKAGVLRAELGAHQEHVVDQDAQTADRNKVPAAVINVAPHEVDSDSGNDESSIATSDSEESCSESDTAQNEPASSLASDSEQYSSCKLPMRQLAVILKTRESLLGQNTTSSQDWSWFLNDGPLRDFPFPCKRVWITLTEC